MTVLHWGRSGERRYQVGLDRGVIYWPNNARPAVAWNGLVSVDETPERETTSYHLDGVKYLEHQSLGNYSAQVKALSYPDEYNILDGHALVVRSVFLHDQLPKQFSFSYRILDGNDAVGETLGYTLHIVYDVLAIPDSRNYASKSDQSQPVEMSWVFKATPQSTPNYRPTAHVSIASWATEAELIQIIEDRLYGTSLAHASLPDLQELMDIVTEFYS